MSPKHLLVPTDFSDDADRAVAYAADLALTLQASLTLMTAVYAGDTPEVHLAYIEKIRAEDKRKLEDVRQRVEKAGVAVKALMAYGAPAQQIVETARREGADLIVMGTHGRTGLSHLLIGSVAERVVRLAPCPVLVVPRG
ncbi:MAG: universal stress protein [Candidatus Tectomicrobia bacterium]|nr:universal stress protein [Candidatus Tectomicrobia bacterium]